MIEMPENDGNINTENLLSFLENQNKQTEPFFDSYCKNNYPLAMLATSERSLVNAIGKIQNENRGFINISSGHIDELEEQRRVILKIIDEDLPFYIDGTSAVFLIEFGIFEKIIEELPNLKIAQPVINLIAELSEKFKLNPGQKGRLGYNQGKINFNLIDKDRTTNIQEKFVVARKLLEGKTKSIGFISSANKSDCFSEKEIPASLCDSCVLAQKENAPILTDDYLYLKFNELETNKKAPEYFSSLILMDVLYKKNKIAFIEYLDYFGFLSSYRCKFLPIHPIDIQKAVFGEGVVATLKPENIRKFNFPLTLSEEYGVSFQTTVRVIGSFLFEIVQDNSIVPDIAEKIFFELINAMPTAINKKNFGQILLNSVIKSIEKKQKALVTVPDNTFLNKKIRQLSNFLKTYDSQALLLI